jgi:uncharacterized protein (TIGR03437 family)
VAATACSSGGSEADVEVALQDTQITLSTDTVPAGDTTFATENQGSQTHEFEIFQTALAPASFSWTGDTADTADLQLMDEVEDVAPSTTVQLTTNLEPGSYILIWARALRPGDARLAHGRVKPSTSNLSLFLVPSVGRW